ncbi:MAG: hypothetical protein V4587_12710 [Acidobacteriota bacterium]
MDKEPPREITALIDTAFGGEVIVVGGMAPYRWTGPNAQGRWFADAEKWVHDLGVAAEKIEEEKIIHSEVVDMHAYIVLSAALSFQVKGQPASRNGGLNFTFARKGNNWKIESQAWGRLS